MAAIAIHRHLAIAHPLLVRHTQTKKHVIVLLVPVWILGAAISLPLLVRGAFHKSLVIVDNRCGIFDRTFVVYSSAVSFFIPLLVMIIVDVRSVYLLRVAANRTLYDRPPLSIQSIIQEDNRFLEEHTSAKWNSKERRAENTLIWVFGCFVCLWMPFFTTNLVYGLCSSCQIPPRLVTVFTWLGYASSGVNPCIYTLLNRDFRRAVITLLRCGRGVERRVHLARRYIRPAGSEMGTSSSRL